MNENFKEEIYVAAFERTIRRLWILCIILIILLAGTNAAWIYYESQWEDVITTESIETNTSDGGAAIGIIGDNNEVNDGRSKDNEDN